MFFVGVFVFIFILWIVLGGPTRPLSFGGPLLLAPDSLGGGSYLSLPKAPSIGSSSVTPSRASGSDRGSSSLSYQDQQAIKEAQKVAAFGTASTYRGITNVSHRVVGAGASNPQNEYIEIRLSTKAKQPVTISGWRIASMVSGKGSTIPYGTEVPRSGTVNASEPIVLNPGDRAILSSGRSPIGASFRENVCIGYFGQYQKFSPSLPRSCPIPKTELATRYEGNLVSDPLCSDYTEKLSRCSIALSPPPTLSSACQAFLINYLNYNGCLNTHQHDYSFKGTTWRVYLGRDSNMWRSDRETIKVSDRDGNTIDLFSY